jgi:hypothetical protein
MVTALPLLSPRISLSRSNCGPYNSQPTLKGLQPCSEDLYSTFRESPAKDDISLSSIFSGDKICATVLAQRNDKPKGL